MRSFAIAAVVLIAGCSKDDDSKQEEPKDYPIVESMSPANNSINVARSKVITANFSDEMDASSISSSSFTLMRGNTSVAGNVSSDGKTAIFEPSSELEASTTYTATINTEAKNVVGQAIASAVTWSFITGVSVEGLAKVDLGSSANYVILAKTAINNIPTAAITGDIGLSPAATSYITGFALTNATGYATSPQITGRIYAADMAPPTSTNLTTAVSDMTTAYNDAAGRPIPDFMELGTGNIGGKTLLPGLYKWTSTVSASSDVVISGSTTDVWIFQIAGDLGIGSGVNVILSGGAKPENIFWQVAGEVSLGTTADFKGIIMSMTGITMSTGAVLNGRALAQTAVVLDANTITQP